MANIPKILKKVEQLQPIPAVVGKVLSLTGEPDPSIEDFVRLVEHDPAITANLLKTCNSAYFGLPIKIDSTQQAVTMLGMQRVFELVVAQNVAGTLQGAQQGYQMQKGDLWKQSVATAMVARNLAERRELFNLPAIYTAALLKDIGKIVLHDFVAHELDRIQALVKSKGFSFAEAETACVGMDHAKLGGIIAKQWNFSPHMVYMIEHHHMLDSAARHDPATGTIYLADMVAMMVGTCIGADRLAYHVYEDIFDDFFLAREELKSLMILYSGFLKEVHVLLQGS